MGHDTLADAQEALRSGDGATARAIVERLPESGEVLAALAKAYYFEHDYTRSIDAWERAYAMYQDEGERLGAVHAARALAFLNGTVVGNAALMSGWQARAKTLLGDEESAEAGWAALSRGQFEGNRAARNAYFAEALSIARRFGDKELEFDALAYLGASFVHEDRFEEGFELLDEACAAVVGSDVSDFMVLSEIFCQLFSACEYAHDVTRADEWIRIGEEIATRRNLATVAAYCRTHYGGVMTAAGRWDEAENALTEAVRLWALGHSQLRSGALIRLADLRVRQGRYEEAEQLLEGFESWPEAARPLAAIRLARGDTALARDIVERALDQLDPGTVAAGQLWALLGEIELARDDIARAATAIEHVDQIATTHVSDYLLALGALMRGRLCLASGSGDPRSCLRDALTRFANIKMPMELAASRLELARAAMADQPEVAVAEAQAAFNAFERLRAAREADAAAAVLRSLGGPARTGPKGAAGVLTKREDEVLALIGLGLSNPEISDRLFISRKTVEHHVGSVLSKLHLRSRAEAAAYAARRESSGAT
jgi:DNA-binding NarL/FixJ family response regulator